MRKILKWTGLVLGSVILLLVVAAAVLYFMGGSKMAATVTLPDEAAPAATADSAMVARGDYLVRTHACTECHGENLEGAVMIDAPPFLVVAPNLTPAGVGASYNALAWERAIRHGVGYDGRGLLPMMPSKLFHGFSDNEIAAVSAYLSSLDPIESELPVTELRPLGRIIAGTGGLPLASEVIDHSEVHPSTAPPMGPTAEYGQHRTTTLCTYCHGATLEGGTQGDEFDGPPLFTVSAWTQEQFVHALREGVRPNGDSLNAVTMPWKAFRHMTDDELIALHMYLSTLPPPGGNVAAGG